MGVPARKGAFPWVRQPASPPPNDRSYGLGAGWGGSGNGWAGWKVGAAAAGAERRTRVERRFHSLH
eukprot:9300243-Pyramimonas_sp.AAC.1